jgi:hypothetical protein
MSAAEWPPSDNNTTEQLRKTSAHPVVFRNRSTASHCRFVS